MFDRNTYNDEYPTCNSTYATLRIVGGDDHPNTISEALELTASSMVVKGEEGVWRDGRFTPDETGRVRRYNAWSFNTSDYSDSRDALRHIDFIAEKLLPKKEQLEHLRSQGWGMDIVVFWESLGGHGGPSLTPATMQALAELNIPIWFDIYFAEDEEEEEWDEDSAVVEV